VEKSSVKQYGKSNYIVADTDDIGVDT